ncbi:MAG: hypothetical protein AB8C13_00500 [Phycisphaerales bacterium]
MKLNQRFAGCLLLWSVLPAGAQSIVEDTKLTTTDAASFDNFGASVGISGNIGIVGVPGDDDSAIDSGSAYLYELSTGQQLFKLRASDAESEDSFGAAVAISGTRAIVGAPILNSFNSESLGTAYLFDTTTGQELFRFVASDASASDQFGSTVAISGSIAVVGAAGNDEGGSLSGSAYVFDTITGQQLFKLTASDAVAFDLFGQSVAVSGTLAIIGAAGNDDAGSSSGSAYIFDTTTGQQLLKIAAIDAAEVNQFGYSVAISGNRAVVGSIGDDDAGMNSGSAYIFDATTGQQLLKLTATDAMESDFFGESVAISGDIAVIGALNSEGVTTNTGTAFVFDIATGEQILELTSSDGAMFDLFGTSVGISGNTIVAGAPRGDGKEGVDIGSAYVYYLGPIVDQQPESIIVDAGVFASFSITLNDDSDADYQWRRDGVPLMDSLTVMGVNSAVLQVLGDEGAVGFYDCLITNPYGDVTSDTAILAVRSDPDACVVDLNDDGALNFFDVSEFLLRFGMGCP